MFLRQIRSFHATSRKFDLSKMTIVGRVGSDFTEFTSANNTRYLKYSVASQPRRDGATNWFNITVFIDPQINFLTQYVRKGYVSRPYGVFNLHKEEFLLTLYTAVLWFTLRLTLLTIPSKEKTALREPL
ncbi:hypothetical protein HG535_0B05800 [Zygotorulaspora mrakii]|uniref:Single-stranded DNA-binding protein RIM1, mitochondrial n=1 Tax=Zygotorulaspora mrakii TaxID=42260 RepID=A0A7H9AZA3_ZYGMR|nr:uncharacterized protein HG535_0B05800 [Zygotorulaspora mrakii]QLG71536.1 hypothetical protein HG535_0B05800 [Zygotorulaspora mrakii]